MSEPLVSIVIPSYNCAVYLEHTLASVVDQSFADWEAIVSDDASTDASAEVAQTFAARDRRIIPLRSNENRGPAASRNRAIGEARGRYIAFLDGDDRWKPAKLERQLEFMQRHRSPFSFTAMQPILYDGRFAQPQRKVPATITYGRLLRSNVIGCSTVLVDREITGDFFMPDLSRRQDFATWLMLLHRVPAAHGLNEPLTDYMVRSGSLTASTLRSIRATWSVYRHAERLPFLTAGIYYLNNLVRATLRRVTGW